MRCRRMQGADRPRTHRQSQEGLRADHPKASEIDVCCRVTPLVRCATLCSGITASPLCGLWYYSTRGTGHNQSHM